MTSDAREDALEPKRERLRGAGNRFRAVGRPAPRRPRCGERVTARASTARAASSIVP